MPSIDDNRRMWDGEYDWADRGEGWSAPWGDPAAQWYGAILPRIRSLLPCGSVLEIGSGRGRWTRFLLERCQRYVGVDLSLACVRHCRRRFGRGRFVLGDGRTLPGGSFDLVFSFDSLVHADYDALEPYLEQTLARLAPGGAAFFHHANLGALDPAPDGEHWRSPEVDAGGVRARVGAAGGEVLIQEIISWNKVPGLDCFTAFARRGERRASGRVVVNDRFHLEADHIREHIAPWDLRRRSG